VSQDQADELALLRADLWALKGRLAGQTRSPLASNGQPGAPRPPDQIKTLQDAFAAACFETGYKARD
jgi:hypothetical protein